METKQTLVTQICPSSTQAWVKKGALLVDVREKNEVAELSYDVPNIINIPLTEFDLRYPELPASQDLVMVCRSGARSLRAAGFLINHGYDPEKVVNMKHGIIRWVQKGFPTKGDISEILANAASTECCGHTEHPKKKSCCQPNKADSSACC
jgi:rhodanese-related sulfurtransferase